MQRFLAFAGCLWLAVACAPHTSITEQATGPILQVTGIEIHNALPYTVRDVTILIPASSEYVSCGQILPESSCSTSFPVRDYRETSVQLSWNEHGEPHSTQPFKLQAPLAAGNGQKAYIRVEVFAKGQAGAELILLDEEAP